MRKSLLTLFFLLLTACLLHAAPKPQRDLPKATLSLGTNTLAAQIAADDPSRELGLMSRTNLGTDEGMVFVFPSPRQVTFWMKDTPTPLSHCLRRPLGEDLRDPRPQALRRDTDPQRLECGPLRNRGFAGMV